MRKAYEILKSKDGKRIICIDEENSDSILEYINQDEKHKKKFNYIVQVILEGHKNCDVYDKEDINDKCKDVTAMKFFKGGDNDRIYCKEISLDDKTYVVVASELYKKKKTNKNSKKNKPIIEKIGKYKYEIIRKEDSNN